MHSATLTNPQFAFALFISARVLHADATFHSTTLAPAFGSLLTSLQEISRRWKGPHEGPTENLASRFASRLGKAQYSASSSDVLPSLDIRQTAYSDQVEPVITSAFGIDDFSQCSPDSISLAFPPLPLSFQHNQINTKPGPARDTQPENHMFDAPEVDYDAGAPGTEVTNLGLVDSMHSFEELSQFFNDPFSSYERISTFSGGHEISHRGS